MINTLRTYIPKDFEDIYWCNSHLVNIPENTKKTIDNIIHQVCSPGYEKTPNFHHEKKHKKRRHRGNHETSEEDWEAIRTFQKTQIERKEGIQKKVDELRLLLNKITQKTYEKISTMVYEKIDEIVVLANENDDGNSDADLISSTIFTIATTNKFNSSLYASLYTQLFEKYDFIKNDFKERMKNVETIYDTINYVSPDEDYDLFCKYNLENEKRRATTTFMVNLMKESLIEKETLINIADNIIQKIKMLIDDDDNEAKVEELSENIYILTVEPYKLMNGSIDHIIEDIKKISLYKTKDYSSLTHKTVFKFMDILDNI